MRRSPGPSEQQGPVNTASCRAHRKTWSSLTLGTTPPNGMFVEPLSGGPLVKLRCRGRLANHLRDQPLSWLGVDAGSMDLVDALLLCYEML